MLHLDHRSARPVYSQIVEQVRLQIRAGILRPGEKLPSVRDLAAQLAINPNTIQRAYREMEMEGLIASEPGKGSFVKEQQPVQPKETLLKNFDCATDALLEAGISRQELIQRLTQGGDTHA